MENIKVAASMGDEKAQEILKSNTVGWENLHL